MSSSNFHPKKDPQSSLRTCPTTCHLPTKIRIVCSFAFCLITSWITVLQVEVSLFASLVSTKRKSRYRRPGGGGILLGILGGGVPPGSPNPDPISEQNCNFPHPFLDYTPKIHTPGFPTHLENPWKSLNVRWKFKALKALENCSRCWKVLEFQC